MNAEPIPRVRLRQGDFFWFAEMGSELPTGLFFAGWTFGASGRRFTSYNLQEDAHPKNGGHGIMTFFSMSYSSQGQGFWFPWPHFPTDSHKLG